MRILILASLAVLVVGDQAAAQSGAVVTIPASGGRPAQVLDASGGITVIIGDVPPAVTPGPTTAPVMAGSQAYVSPTPSPVKPITDIRFVEPDAVAAPAQPAQVAFKISPQAQNAYLILVAPAQAMVGETPLKEPFLVATLKPAQTGRLLEAIHSPGGPQPAYAEVPAGSPIYGVSLGGRQFWCARGVEEGFLIKRRDSVCFRKEGETWRRSPAPDVPYVARINLTENDKPIYPPAISREPVEFDPFQIGYVVTHWSTRAVEVKMRLLSDDKSYDMSCVFTLDRDQTGSASLVAFSNLYRIAPGADLKSTNINLVGPATADDKARQSASACPLTQTYGAPSYGGSIIYRTARSGGGRHR